MVSRINGCIWIAGRFNHLNCEYFSGRLVRMPSRLGYKWKSHDDIPEFDCQTAKGESEKRWRTAAYSTKSSWKRYCQHWSHAIPTSYTSLFSSYHYIFPILFELVCFSEISAWFMYFSSTEMWSPIIIIRSKYSMTFSSIWRLIPKIV